MKTIFKSLLYFSFAGLILTGCAKNDDFSVPPINCDEPNITATQTIDGLYNSLTENSKEVVLYPKDEIISGIVISSDQAGNFYQQLYIVDEKTQTPVTLKVDVKGGFALYPVGSKVFMKLKDTYIHYSYGMITIGGGIYTSSGGNKYADVITGSKLRTSLFRSCDVITGDNFKKYINEVTLDQFATDKKLFGKLVRIKDVQFDRNVVGKTYFDAKDVDGGGQTLRKMVDKKGNALQVRTGQYANGIKDQIITDRSGTVTGIMSDYQGTLQFAPRTMDDMALDQDPFEGGNGGNEGEDPNMKVEPGKFLAFPGSDFNTWADFLKVIVKNTPGDPMVTEGKGLGWNNSNGLQVKGVAALNNGKAANGALFTVEKIKAPKDATKISFLMKGTAGKSISINVYKANGVNYFAYNLENVGAVSKVLQPNMKETIFDNVPSGNTTNSYTGKIDTKGQWVKVVLDLKELKGDFSTAGTGNLIAFRYGHTESYDLVIDEIRFEDGTPVKDDGGTTDPEVPDDLTEAKALSENFDTIAEKSNNYSAKDLDYPSGTWSFVDGGVFKDAQDLKASGEYSIRLRGGDKVDASVQTKFVVTGLKKVEFQFGGATFNEGADGEKEIAVELFYSVDSGKTWKSAGTKTGKRGELAAASFDINAKATDKVVVKIQNTSFLRPASANTRLRISIDDIKFIK